MPQQLKVQTVQKSFCQWGKTKALMSRLCEMITLIKAGEQTEFVLKHQFSFHSDLTNTTRA